MALIADLLIIIPNRDGNQQRFQDSYQFQYIHVSLMFRIFKVSTINKSAKFQSYMNHLKLRNSPKIQDQLSTTATGPTGKGRGQLPSSSQPLTRVPGPTVLVISRGWGQVRWDGMAVLHI